MISVSLNYDLPDGVEAPDVTACVQLGLFVHSAPVIFGGWQCLITFNGERLCRVSEWRESYSQGGEDNENGCELIEIESDLSCGFRLRRFFLLDELNRIFIACDSLTRGSDVSNCDGALEYESSIVYSDKLQTKRLGRAMSDILFRPDPKLRGFQRVAFRVIPLALSSAKFLHASNGKICYGQNRNAYNGLSMFAPVFFDFKMSRADKKAIWRELTVGENLEKVTPDKAAGYRVQIGKDQFLLYYSLTPPANRTLLGHNLIDEICYAKFDPKTGVKPLLTK
jgi:hypothetical protein